VAPIRGEVQKLLSACNENIRTLVAVLIGTGMRLDEALHLMWTDIDLQHRVIHVRCRRGAPKSGRLRHVPIFDSVLTVLREVKLAKGENTLLSPGAKRDKFDQQLPRNKTSVFRPFKAAAPPRSPASSWIGDTRRRSARPSRADDAYQRAAVSHALTTVAGRGRYDARSSVTVDDNAFARLISI